MQMRIPDDDGDVLVVLGKRAIGAAVKDARLARGMSQRQLGRRGRVSQPIISRLETGKLNGIRWQTLASVVGALYAGPAFVLLIDGSPPARRLPGQPRTTG